MRRRFSLLVLLAACCSCGVDTLREGRRAAADERPLAEQVDVPGLLSALLLHIETAGSAETAGPGSDRFHTLVHSVWAAMRLADQGRLDPRDVETLRARVVPLLANFVRSAKTAQAFQPWCEAANEEGQVFPHMTQAVLQEPLAEELSRWNEGENTDQAYDRMFRQDHARIDRLVARADCPASYTALGLVSASARQALVNLLRMRAALLEGEIRQIAADPDGYASWLVTNWMPASLGTFAHGAELQVRQVAREVARTLDANMTAQIRQETIAGFDAVVQDVRRAEGREREINAVNPFGGFYPHWCRDQMQLRGPMNVLVHSRTVYLTVCGGAYRAPAASDLPAIVRDLDESVRAYLTKLAESWDSRAGYAVTVIKKVVHNNIAGLSAFLRDMPACVQNACTWIAEANQDRASRLFWQNVVLWGSVAVGVVALVTGVGALAVGALGYTALAATLTSVSFVASIAGVGVTLASSTYLGLQGAADLKTARQDLAALMVSGADPRTVRDEYEHALQLVQGALIDATLAVADLVVLVRAIRAARAARPAQALEEAIQARRRTVTRTAFFGTDQRAHAAALRRYALTPPVEPTVSVAGTQYSIGEVFEFGGGRVGAWVRVTTPDGQAFLRFFYRSNSQAEFRLLPAIERYFGRIHFNKGIGQHSLVAPSEVQEVFADRLVRGAVRRDIPADDAMSLIEGGVPVTTNPDNFARFVNQDRDWFPGSTNTDVLAPAQAQAVELPRGRGLRPPRDVVIADPRKAPDFSQRIRTYRTKAALGENGAVDVDVTAEIYRSADGTIEYPVYYESRGTGIWFGDPVPAGSAPGSFGIRNTAIDVGPLSMPPWEYTDEFPELLYDGHATIHPRFRSYTRTWGYRRHLPEVQNYYRVRSGIDAGVPATPPD